MKNDETANYFALCFLMPEDEYIRVYEENLMDNGHEVNTAKIAEHFNVAVSEAAQRGVDLGLIKSW